MKPRFWWLMTIWAVRILLQDVLSEHVFDVLVCHTCQDVPGRVQQTPEIALVLLDMMLPDINGLRCLPQLQSSVRRWLVIALTGLGGMNPDVAVGLEMEPTTILANRLIRAWCCPG